MKKLLLCFIAIAGIVTLKAQSDNASVKKEKNEIRKEMRKAENNEPSFQSKQSFYSDFGDVTDVNWKRTANFDEAVFTKDGKGMKAFYDIDAKLVGTVTNKIFADLPACAQTYINKKYSGYSKGRVIFYDDNEYNETDMELYGNVFDDEDNYFIEMGKDDKNIVLKVNMDGDVTYFAEVH